MEKHTCNGNCSSCGTGCDAKGGPDCRIGELILTEGELRLLDTFASIPFLPVARKMGDLTPVYLEEQDYPAEEYSLLLECLEKRGLISIDYSQPLKNFDDSAYAAYPIRGSMALTERGQQVVELLETQGLTD